MKTDKRKALEAYMRALSIEAKRLANITRRYQHEPLTEQQAHDWCLATLSQLKDVVSFHDDIDELYRKHLMR